MNLPAGYHLVWVDEGATLRRPDGTAIAWFGDNATGKDIVEVAYTDLDMRNGMLDAVYADLERMA